MTAPRLPDTAPARQAAAICARLREAGHRALLAGGCVRDLLLDAVPKDFDVATDARPERVQALFPRTVAVGAAFGVVVVVTESGPVEVATFRAEGAYSDGRHPDSVSFGDAEADAQRRDFTVNGLFLDPLAGEVVDYVGGLADLKAKRLRAIGDPGLRFREDHLRLLRAARFAGLLGFGVDPATAAAVRRDAALLATVSPERIQQELSKMLLSPRRAEALRRTSDLGLMGVFLPEVETMKGVEQPPEFHPEGDVFLHTMLVLDHLPPDASLTLALGGLLHDVAKPATFQRADRIRFNNHDRVGAEMSVAILQRLKFPNAVIERVEYLVAEHLRWKDTPNMRLSTLKRFLAAEGFEELLALYVADCKGSHGKLDFYDFCVSKKAEFGVEKLKPAKLLTGHDLVTLGMAPGPKMGEILKALEEEQLEGRINSRDEAMAWARRRL